MQPTKAALIEEFRPCADEHYGADDGSLVAATRELVTVTIAPSNMLSWQCRSISCHRPARCRSPPALVTVGSWTEEARSTSSTSASAY